MRSRTHYTNTASVLALAVILVVSLSALPLSAAGAVGTNPAAEQTGGDLEPSATLQNHSTAVDDRPDDSRTNETIGYVEGYWYDDSLPVDDRDDATLEEDELESVVYRSMARVEVIRNLTFDDEVPVEVITREEFDAEMDELFGDLTESDHLRQNIHFETLFMVDRETNATEEVMDMYGGAVAGYYDPEETEAVVVSDDPDDLEMNEITLGHELLHALQDQHYDLEEFVGETRDQDNAYDGLIEGDAVRVDTEYEQRCQDEWECVLPVGDPVPPPAEPNWGIYFTFLQPYEDGSEFVDHLLDSGDGENEHTNENENENATDDRWTPVNEAYDDPPNHTAEIIRPEEYGTFEPVDIDHEDRSSDRWQELEADEQADRSSFGEAAMATMFVAPALEDPAESVITIEEFLELGPAGEIEAIDYDQPITDGWAGDKLVKYVTEDESIEESGSVWHTEWQSDDDAQQFFEGYLELLEIHGGETADDRAETFVIDEHFPGAYAVEHDGESVTIVRAPSVDELEEIHDGVSLEGEA